MGEEHGFVTSNCNSPTKIGLQFWVGLLAEERSRLASPGLCMLFLLCSDGCSE